MTLETQNLKSTRNPKIHESIKLSKNKPTEHWTQHIPDERKQQPSRCALCNIQCVHGSNITIRQKNGLAMKLIIQAHCNAKCVCEFMHYRKDRKALCKMCMYTKMHVVCACHTRLHIVSHNIAKH